MQLKILDLVDCCHIKLMLYNKITVHKERGILQDSSFSSLFFFPSLPCNLQFIPLSAVT